MGRVNISESAVVGKERNVEDTKLRRLPQCGAAVHHKRRMRSQCMDGIQDACHERGHPRERKGTRERNAEGKGREGKGREGKGKKRATTCEEGAPYEAQRRSRSVPRHGRVSGQRNPDAGRVILSPRGINVLGDANQNEVSRAGQVGRQMADRA
jgi:hypothetical protein